ncbi:hypothetical protein BDV93DRAFT_561416 [Ceratobasidium sp. AG-I]|nr:hypothetical protein BDV93DRAFT_561416 [Ceratobasidium sp. AG-I]
MVGSAPYTPEQIAEYEDVLEQLRSIENTKYLAIAAYTILIYDILCTLDIEVQNIWASKWSFVRVVFHINRVWAVTILSVYIPTLFMYNLSEQKQQIIPNPAPDLITACHFTANALAFLPYIASIVYETVIFSLTIYRTWRLSREYMATPLITRLLRDGSCYYFVVLGVMLFTSLGCLNPQIASPAIGSGYVRKLL